ARVVDVAYKWLAVIRSTPSDELHTDDFLQRVKRSAGYFLQTLEEELGDVITLTRQAKSQNQRGMEQMEERYKELWLAYLAKDKLLRRMEEEPFTVSAYMLAKQEAMLDALDVVAPGSVRRRA
ncbi:hypothetical protein FO502_20335, partial [Bacillus pumilus]